MLIDERPIGNGHTFIMADISCNHMQSNPLATILIEDACAAGCDAVKFQLYEAADLEPDGEWRGILGMATTPPEWLPDLFGIVRDMGMVPLATPFSVRAVETLEDLNPAVYKVASASCTDGRLLEAIADTGKPCIVSLGMATLSDALFVRDRIEDLAFLVCTAAYPSSPQDARLPMIAALHEEFGCPVGLSDHSRSVSLPAVSVAYGASIIEAHIMRKGTAPLDKDWSLDGEEFWQMVRHVRDAESACQWDGTMGVTESETVCWDGLMVKRKERLRSD